MPRPTRSSTATRTDPAATTTSAAARGSTGGTAVVPGRPGRRRGAVLLAWVVAGLPSCAATLTEAFPIRVASYNVRHGQGDDSRSIADNLPVQARILREQRPDLVALQEIDRRCQRSGGVDQTAVFAELTGLHGVFARFMEFQGGEYGLAVLSCQEVADSVVRLALPPGRSEPRTALLCTYRPAPGVAVVFGCVHFDWYRDSAERVQQARRLVEYLADVDWPVIIVGDYNAEPGSPTLQVFEAAGFEYVRKAGAPATFSAAQPRVEIDHVFIRSSATIKLHADPIRVLPETRASDHRPLVTTVYATPVRLR